MNVELQDAVTLTRDLAIDAELAAAITTTGVELEYVQGLIKIRGRTDALTTDELEVMARLADLHIQANYKDLGILKRDASGRAISASLPPNPASST